MLIRSFILLLAAGIWGAVLQLAARPAIATVPLIPAIAIHVFPPLFLWLAWLAARWRASSLRRRQEELRAAEEASRREAERAAARQRHDDELRRRRFCCDCRAVAISVAKMEALPFIDTLPPNAVVSVLEEVSRSNWSAMERLRPAVADALALVYSNCPAATMLPIYVKPPANVPGNEVMDLVRTIRAELVDTNLGDALDSIPVLFLPVTDAASNSLLALFENAPDLPGATVLAFDSPVSRAAVDDDNEEAPRYPHQFPEGVPNEGAVALFVTNANLSGMLDAVSGLTPAPGEDDAMTPFWERTQVPDDLSALLVRMPAAMRAELAALPTLGHIHRASAAEVESPRAGVLDMTRVFQGLLENAQVDAALLDKPFTLDDAAAPEEKDPAKPPQCTRLVHNAGIAGKGGKRLAALGSAMLYFGIDFSPVDENVAINALGCLGDLGCATSMAQLALGIMRAAESGTPGLNAEFSGQAGVAVSIVVPSTAPA